MTERGPDTMGGHYRGGLEHQAADERAPARQIPWAEIFRHHISVVEGHLKMVEMVRGHTVEGSGNFRTIMGCVGRAKEMLQASKELSKQFVSPPKQREQVPLGSSSASTYPGYSPADHEYGRAAEEYGEAAAEARANGIEIQHPDAEYGSGQAKGVKRRKTLAEIREVGAAKGRGNSGASGAGSGSEGLVNQEVTEPAKINGQGSTEKVQKATPEGDNPSFVIDSKPTPVNMQTMSFQALKRSASSQEAVAAKKHKKAKHKHNGEMPKGEDTQEVRTEDISERVDARMKEKEEKRKMKEGKKRKRESEGKPAAAAEEPEAAAEPSVTAAEMERPKKKKKVKKTEEEALPDRTATKKRLGEDEIQAENGESKKAAKRKKKKKKETATDSDV